MYLLIYFIFFIIKNIFDGYVFFRLSCSFLNGQGAFFHGKGLEFEKRFFFFQSFEFNLKY